MKAVTSLHIAALLSSATALKVAEYSLKGTPLHERGLPDALFKRDAATLATSLSRSDSAYLINLTIGTPPQSVAVQLDTGSSELWVLKEGVPYCKNNTCDGGFFEPSKSSTYEVLKQGGFNNTYGVTSSGGRYARGDTAEDTISVGQAVVESQRFSVVNDTTQHAGIMGIGYRLNQADCAQNGIANCKPYPSYLDNLVDQDIVSSLAYSMYLNDTFAATGSLLFGGVDTSKYSGDLVALPVLAKNGSYTEFSVSLTGMTIGTADKALDIVWTKGEVYGALLDSGTTLAFLPPSVVANLYTAMAARRVDPPQGDSIWIVDCNLLKSDLEAAFQFGGSNGITIKVPIRDLILEFQAGATTSYFNNGDAICSTAFQVSDQNVVLGDIFLRHAYVVYDLANNQIGLAQSNLKPGQANIKEIDSKIPGIARTGAAASATTVSTPLSFTYTTVPFTATDVAAPSNYVLQSFITGTYTKTNVAPGNGAASATGSAGSGGAGNTANPTRSAASAGTPSVSRAVQSSGSIAPGPVLSSSMPNMLILTSIALFVVSGAGMIML